ncbi:BQ5605_C036g11519 [Microbotryum silenes-dioicae]|uniref:BQ5605_C036g11519 protein n=1 Tax=Microbotryum silenes-dioicae TaxID=796604 RepID=A0A2X0N916_9BASI|nr:BQ5605_C036g11519 [Microbotryum silenes-dioicae]
MTVPFPTAADATLLQRVVSVDQLLRPSELSRRVCVEAASLHIEFIAHSVRQARVALDHCLSDIQMVVQTMRKFGPEAAVDGIEADASIEVGLRGSWEGAQR